MPSNKPADVPTVEGPALMAIGAPEDCATEAGWVVEGPGVVLEIWPEVGTFVTGCDLAAEVVGTTVGSVIKVKK